MRSRVARSILVLVLAAAALAAAPTARSAAESVSTVKVYFLQGEQVRPVARPGRTLSEAIGALLAGPSLAERGRRIATEVPADVPLRGVELRNGVATVDLGAEFEAGSDPASRSARVAQVVLTATAFPSVREVRLLVGGREMPAPATRAEVLAPPAPLAPVPAEPPLPVLARAIDVRALQQRLADLGYLPEFGVDGLFGEQTRNAVIAFQKWERLDRDGIPGPKTMGALAEAKRPTPRTRRPGARVEVLLDRQLALAIQNGRVLRTIHVSTGARGHATPRGSYAVFRKRKRSWSVPYKIWLPWASYFVRGVAFHESARVPVRTASHGCVRVSRFDARWLYRRTPVGTRVTVLRRS